MATLDEKVATFENQMKILITQNATIIEDNKTIIETMKTLTEEVKSIKLFQAETAKKMSKMHQRIIEMEDEVTILTTTNNKLEQQALSRDVTIFGLPSLKREQLPSLISSLSAVSSVPLNESDFVHVYPTRVRNKPLCNVHLKFFNEQKKAEFMKSVKQKKPILTEDLVELQPADKARGNEIIIRQKITDINRGILNEARNQKAKIKFAWEKDGRILIQLTETSPITEVQSLNQLMEIVTRTSQPSSSAINMSH